MTSKIEIDIVIPVLDEEDTIKENVSIIVKYLIDQEFRSKSRHFRLLIGDNGSTDKTPEFALELKKKYPDRIEYIRTEERGVGRILKKAWLESNADIVGYMDLDIAVDLKHLNEAIEAIVDRGADIVYGTRRHKNSEVIGRSFYRNIVSNVFNNILRYYVGTNFSDGMCGFKFLKREHVSRLIKLGADNDGWFFCTEILIVGEWLGLNLNELPVKWTDDPASKVKVGKLAIQYIKGMHRLKKLKKWIINA